MLFTSFYFLVFVLITLFVYYIVQKRFQWIVLLCANIYFYAYAGLGGILFIAATICTTYIGARYIDADKQKTKEYLAQEKEQLTKEEKKAYKTKAQSRQKRCLATVLLINFGILAVLKYTNFIILSFTTFQTVDLILPMGISFYTFQSMGYLIDVYRGKADAEQNVFRFALFVSFFPQLVQGPINRWNDLKETMFVEHAFEWNRIRSGAERMLWGYFKKMVIADRASIALATITGDTSTYYGAYAFVGMLLYAVELYADFTGGIDVTIGVAELFGIRLAENFHRPFFSKNIAEYWRRWHITLCAWFKDYLFYPLSMSKWMNKTSKVLKKRVGKAVGSRFPVYFSSLTVWFVTGIWHGASWNFVVWGLLNSMVMLLSQEFKPLYEKTNHKLHYRNIPCYKVFEILRTTAIVCVLQMLDYYRNIAEAFKMMASMFFPGNYANVLTDGIFHLGLTMADYFVLLMGIIIIWCVSMLQRKQAIRKRLSTKPYLRYVIFMLLFLAIVVFGTYGIGYESSQFIYNQF